MVATRTAWKVAAAFAVVVVVAVLSVAGPVSGSTNEQIVSDPATGLALYGFDPVAYFVDGTARRGREEHEHGWAGATWRFVNKGNMAAFRDSPDVYCPRYGGHDVVSVARGLPTEGKPVIFEFLDGRLYFFYSQANRHIWLSDPQGLTEQADRNWDAIRKKLAK